MSEGRSTKLAHRQPERMLWLWTPRSKINAMQLAVKKHGFHLDCLTPHIPPGARPGHLQGRLYYECKSLHGDWIATINFIPNTETIFFWSAYIQLTPVIGKSTKASFSTRLIISTDNFFQRSTCNWRMKKIKNTLSWDDTLFRFAPETCTLRANNSSLVRTATWSPDTNLKKCLIMQSFFEIFEI